MSQSIENNNPEINEKIQGITIYGESKASENHPDRNEDSMFYDAHKKAFGVFDGMGGENGGAKASGLAEAVVEQALANRTNNLTLEQSQNLIAEAIQNANKVICQEAQKSIEFSRMGTTASVGLIWEGPSGEKKLVIGNVGDSRVYLLRQGKLVQVTIDDNLARSNNEEESRARQRKFNNVVSHDDLTDQMDKILFENRNQITQALGSREIQPRINTVDLVPGDQIFVCSDGIADNLTDNEIETILAGSQDSNQAVKKLLEAAQNRSHTGSHLRAKKDDMTALVAEINQISPQQVPQPPQEIINIQEGPANISETKSFDELYSYLAAHGGMQGSNRHFSAQELFVLINKVMSGEGEVDTITRTEGLRDKVDELLLAQNIAKIKDFPSLYDLLLKPDVSIRGSKDNFDGWSLIQKIDKVRTNPSLIDKITRSCGLRKKVRELLGI